MNSSPRSASDAAGWEHFSHVADVGVRGYGATLAEAFEQVALALTAVVVDPATVASREPVEIECRAPQPDILLVDWLNALVFEMATRRMLFSRFEVRSDGAMLHARAWGERVDVARHQPATEVKGATLSELVVARDADGRWRAQCIVDV